MACGQWRPALLVARGLAARVPHSFSQEAVTGSGCLHQRYFAEPAVATEPAQPQPQQQAAVPNAGVAAAGGGAPPPPTLDFTDGRQAFAAKSTPELLRQILVLRTSQVRPIVANADRLIDLSERVLGSTLTNAVVRRTFFAHFCAGESSDGIQPTLARLRESGIGAILDYAAEDDVKDEGPTQSREEPQDTVVARTFFYEDEAKCDRHMRTFEHAIDAAATQAGTGFAAIKVTALGKPALLERVSNSLVAIRGLFAMFDEDGDGTIGREEFRRVYGQLFGDETDERLEELYGYLDYEHRGQVDYENWSRQVRCTHAPLIAARCRTKGPFSSTVLSAHELQLVENMMARLHRLAERAAKKGVRLMVDAEHSYFQPAIDHAALELQRVHNRAGAALVYNTYQCYLRDSVERLQLDMARAAHEGHAFGAKLVRGAYMALERQRAADKGYPSPIWDTAAETHACYDACVAAVLDRVAEAKLEPAAVPKHPEFEGGGGAEVMVATHNQASVEATVAGMRARGLTPGQSGVFFGQLLGMADHLSFTLGAAGYKAFKYVPFGPVELVMPYLIRRAQENSDIMGGVSGELSMLQEEVWRRMTTPVRGLFNSSGARPAAASAAASASAGVP